MRHRDKIDRIERAYALLLDLAPHVQGPEHTIVMRAVGCVRDLRRRAAALKVS